MEPDKPTASALDLAHECCHAWAPGVTRVRSGGRAASGGTALHAVAAHCINERVPLDVVLDLEPVAKVNNLSEEQVDILYRQVDGCRPLWFAMAEDGDRAEVAFAYDPATDTARELPPGVAPRDYSQATPSEFAGTADVVHLEPNSATVHDWKCGQRQYVTVPAQNHQLRFLALCVARAYGRENVTVKLRFVDPEGQVSEESATFGPFDLAAIAGEMAALATELEAGPCPKPGTQCQWCPAVASCSSTHESLVQVAPTPPPEPFLVVADVAEITGPDHATWMLHRLKAVLSAAEVVERALKAFADANGGIKTGDGTVWKRHEIPVERIVLDDQSRAELERALPGAVKFTSTKTAIRDAARAAKLPLKKTEDEVLALLRPLGAVKPSVTVKYEDR